jgi:hypothetical protein
MCHVLAIPRLTADKCLQAQRVRARTEEANQNKSKQIKTNQNKSKQIKTNQNKSKQIKTNQIKTNQNKSKQSHPEMEQTWPPRASKRATLRSAGVTRRST